MFDRCNISDRASATFATNVLMDQGIIKPNDTNFVIDKSKLQRERMRFREEISKELFDKVDGLYVDGKNKEIR